jgi:hypothetical protein
MECVYCAVRTGSLHVIQPLKELKLDSVTSNVGYYVLFSFVCILSWVTACLPFPIWPPGSFNQRIFRKFSSLLFQWTISIETPDCVWFFLPTPCFLYNFHSGLEPLRNRTVQKPETLSKWGCMRLHYPYRRMCFGLLVAAGVHGGASPIFTVETSGRFIEDVGLTGSAGTWSRRRC